MLHLEAEWPSKENILIADTILSSFEGAKYIFREERFLFLLFV